MLLTIISTKKGWIIRQVLKAASSASAIISSAFITKSVSYGLDHDKVTDIASIITTSTEGIIVGLASLALMGIETYLSKQASPIATKG